MAIGMLMSVAEVGYFGGVLDVSFKRASKIVKKQAVQLVVL